MRLAVLAAIATAAVLVAPRPAEACSCYVPLVISPANGATDVPTNAVFVIASGWSDPTYTSLAGPDDAPALETTVVYEGIERLELVEPVEPLAPRTDYFLTVGFEVIAFRTGDGPDTEPPAPAELGELTIKHAHPAGQGSSCGDEHLDIDLAITLPPDAVAAEIFVEGFTQQFRHVVTGDQLDWPLGGSSDDCTRNFPLEGGDQVCFEVRSRDQAGNLAVATERCTTVIACAPNDAGDLDDCEPAAPGLSSSAGCGATPEPPAALALLLLAGYAVRRSCRYARKCRIAARADARSPARS